MVPAEETLTLMRIAVPQTDFGNVTAMAVLNSGLC